MKLTGTSLDRSRSPIRWVAVWTTDSGNTIHDRLPFNATGTSEVDAWVYALDHQPSWGPADA